MGAVERLLDAWRWRRLGDDDEPYGYRLPRQGVAVPVLVAIVLLGATAGGWLGTRVGHSSPAKTQAPSLLGLPAAAPSAAPTADEFATRLEHAITQLAAARANARLQLSGASAPAAQAAAATKLSDAYRAAARRLGPLAQGAPARQARILVALQAAAKGYGMLAAAARSGDKAGYATAAKAVGAAEAQLEQLIGSRGSLA